MSFSGTITLDSSGQPDYTDFSGHNGEITIDCTAATSLADSAFRDNTTFESAASVKFDGVPWAQVGDQINGKAFNDRGGESVAISSDGSRVAIGAPWNDENGNNAGQVGIYDWSGTAWVQVGADIYGEAADNWMGWLYSLALNSDGSRVAIGARYNDANGNLAGHVRIYEWNETAWVQVGANIDGEAAGDQSGSSIALSSDGSRVAIGAWLNDGGGGQYVGHVRIYDWSETAWVQVGTDIDGEADEDGSGYSLALSGDGYHVAIGSPYNNASGYQAGHVRIYEWSEIALDWVQVGADIDGEAAGDQSSTSVSISSDGSRVAIGAPFNDGNGSNTGHVRIYEWSEIALDWEQVGEDIYGEAASDASGYAVALSSDGSRVAIGARYANEGRGQVRIYDWSGTAWVQVGSDIDGEAMNDGSGYAVALSGDGSHVIIGAPYSDANGGSSGHASIYNLTFELGTSCFRGSTLTSISIASIKTIGSSAFRDSSLTTITFETGSTLEMMGDSALRNSSITSIEIPSSVTTIGSSAFRDSSLTTITFETGSTLEMMGDSALRDHLKQVPR